MFLEFSKFVVKSESKKFSSKKVLAFTPSDSSTLLAMRQGSRSEVPSAFDSDGGPFWATIGWQLVRNVL